MAAIPKKRPVKHKTAAAKRSPARAAASTVADHPTRRTRKPTLAAVVEKALPGWELAEMPAEQSSSDEDKVMATDQEPSIAYLKRKFLGEQAADSTDENILEKADDRRPVRVRPKQGGKAKTADVTPDGKVTIVQG